MGLLADLLRPERRFLSIADIDALFERGPTTLSSTGLPIGPTTALSSPVVYACVNVLAQTIAALPLLVYRRLPDGGKERAPYHPLYDLLHTAPNPEMTAYEFRSCLVGHQALWGNAYAEIERSDAKINALWPLRPDRMTVQRNAAGELQYSYRLPNGEPKLFAFANIMHWRALSSNGVLGYSPIQMAAEAVGLDLAARQYGARFYGNDSRPGGVLKSAGKLSDSAAKRLKDSWESAHQGLSNSQRVAVLEDGVEWQQIGIPPEQAQFLESRKYQRSEIAALYRVPLHMINDLERATFSNIEHQSLEFVKFTLYPWLVQIEQAIQRDLFRISAGKRAHFGEHLVDGLLRGDIQSRYTAYQIARLNGWMNANEIRERENMNPIADEVGAKYWMPANMTVAGEPRPQAAPLALPQAEPAAEPEDDTDEAEPEEETDAVGD